MGSVIESSLSSAESGYLFDSRASGAGQRFDVLSARTGPPIVVMNWAPATGAGPVRSG